jgi:hypothetical protein
VNACPYATARGRDIRGVRRQYTNPYIQAGKKAMTYHHSPSCHVMCENGSDADLIDVATNT